MKKFLVNHHGYQIEVTVDDKHYDRVMTKTWCISNGRVRAAGGEVYLSRFILNYDGPNEIDHINGDTFDNREENLRIATRTLQGLNRHAKNSNNTSGLPGVSWAKSHSKWEAKISIKGKTIHLGRFSEKERAYQAYLSAKHFYMQSEKA